MPLHLVECPKFWALLYYLNLNINYELPSAYKTIYK
jgi:hypothetical protein